MYTCGPGPGLAAQHKTQGRHETGLEAQPSPAHGLALDEGRRWLRTFTGPTKWPSAPSPGNHSGSGSERDLIQAKSARASSHFLSPEAGSGAPNRGVLRITLAGWRSAAPRSLPGPSQSEGPGPDVASGTTSLAARTQLHVPGWSRGGAICSQITQSCFCPSPAESSPRDGPKGPRG